MAQETLELFVDLAKYPILTPLVNSKIFYRKIESILAKSYKLREINIPECGWYSGRDLYIKLLHSRPEFLKQVGSYKYVPIHYSLVPIRDTRTAIERKEQQESIDSYLFNIARIIYDFSKTQHSSNNVQ